MIQECFFIILVRTKMAMFVLSLYVLIKCVFKLYLSLNHLPTFKLSYHNLYGQFLDIFVANH